MPPWLTPPSSLTASSNSHRPSASSGSGSSMYRAGSKPVSLQDIYDSAGTNQSASSQSRTGRNQDLYATDQGATTRQPLAGDRLRNKLRPSNSRPSPRPGSGDHDGDISGYNRSGSDYSGRSGFGGEDDYDPYNYQQNYQQNPGYETNRSRDPSQGQYGGGQSNRLGGRR